METNKMTTEITKSGYDTVKQLAPVTDAFKKSRTWKFPKLLVSS